MMDDYDKMDRDETKEELVAQGGMDSNEEAFMQGYEQDDEVVECAECGSAVSDEKRVVKTINEEEQIFCSQSCAEDYEESIGDN